MSENAAVGTPLGAPLSAADADNPTLTFELAATPSFPAAFLWLGVDAATGQLRVVRAGLDFESPDVPSVFAVLVTVSDGLLRASATVEVQVLDVNEVQTCVPFPNATVTENGAVPAVLGAVACTDPDAGASLTYALPVVVPSSTAFAVGAGGVVSVLRPLDFEAVQVRRDGTGPPYVAVILTPGRGERGDECWGWVLGWGGVGWCGGWWCGAELAALLLGPPVPLGMREVRARGCVSPTPFASVPACVAPRPGCRSTVSWLRAPRPCPAWLSTPMCLCWCGT